MKIENSNNRAGNIGLNIIKMIERDYPEISCKIIDNNLERTKLISSISNQNTILMVML